MMRALYRKEVPLTLRTPQPALLLAAQLWISHQPYSSFVNVTAGLAHARFVSPVWGFTDDFIIRVSPAACCLLKSAHSIMSPAAIGVVAFIMCCHAYIFSSP